MRATYMTCEADTYNQPGVRDGRLVTSVQLTPPAELQVTHSGALLLEADVPNTAIVLSSTLPGGKLTGAAIADTLQTERIYTHPVLNEIGMRPKAVESLRAVVRCALYGNLDRFRYHQLVIVAGSSLVASVSGDANARPGQVYRVDVDWQNENYDPSWAGRYAPALLRAPKR